MSASRWPVVTAALLSALDGDVNLTGKVYDTVPITSDLITDAVFIGAVFSEETGAAGSFTQDWHELGGVPPRDETGTIRCTVLAQRGDTDAAATRTAAFQLLGWVESVCRADYDLGVTDLLWLAVKAGDVRQGQTKNGSYCEIEFRIEYKALI